MTQIMDPIVRLALPVQWAPEVSQAKQVLKAPQVK